MKCCLLKLKVSKLFLKLGFITNGGYKLTQSIQLKHAQFLLLIKKELSLSL
jgi:NOL1/NOP2/fmu family ribosome biogenesis protein